jgi:YidC/Oxa1 family membrane protein insertase
MGHGLEESVDFGWFGVLSRPMLWVLVKFFDFTGNFGIAIILLTLLMKALTFPLTQKSYVSMQQMKTVAPELKKLQEKYKNDRAALGQKQMDLYREKGINPMAGCFPMLVQMPIWFALYRTLWNSVELYQQPFMVGITDLSQPETLLFGFPLLPILVGALMFFQTTLQPPPQDQPQMKYVMWGMPIMFTFFMLQMPSGLSLYMITNSVLTMAQQFYIKRKYS